MNAAAASGRGNVLYTDGLMEHQSVPGPESYFSDMAFQVFEDLKNLPSRDFVTGIYEKLKAFRGGETFSDDICVICVDVK
jgi:serine phosphatase RsbU (regulator of sigma subunit)